MNFSPSITIDKNTLIMIAIELVEAKRVMSANGSTQTWHRFATITDPQPRIIHLALLNPLDPVSFLSAVEWAIFIYTRPYYSIEVAIKSIARA
jgi:hypothetical protein